MPEERNFPTDDNNIGNLMPINVEEELKKSFISYAMAVIVSRALPDVRDGLKPVHRRILYSMAELGVTPDKPFRKSARIVGDVLGKYHPHGDTAVYDAMVRLAQPFSTRALLVEGQGNFGSVDGDGAAAMRYTEARLSKLSMEMVRDLDKETVDFYPNFDETLMQPDVMPARFPNLLVNGSNGIAVGMATNIPPHNLGEVIDACVYMIDNPDCSVADLMQYIKGPDFPTGGIIMGRNGILEAYNTGRGRIVVRARTEIEEMSGNRQRIVVTEIPYMVNKARLVEKIAELVHEKRLDGISDIRDESDRKGMRIAIELKRDVNANVVLNYLYKHTQMQDTFGAIMIALVNGVPKVLTVKQMLYYYIEHQVDVIVRRTKYDLNKAEARAHILEGLLHALDIIDLVIQTIRSSRTTQEARDRLVNELEFTDKQAQAILDMRLQRLTGLEREKLQQEYEELEKLIAYYRQVLSDHGMVLGIIKDELGEVRRRFADERRTEIRQMEYEVALADLIQEEDMVVTLTHRGYIKRLSLSSYRAQRRGGKGVTAAATREEDFVEQLYVMSTHDRVMFFTNKGRAFDLNCYEIPEAGRTARGMAIVNLLRLEAEERVTSMLRLDMDRLEGYYIVMATRDGLIKRTALSEFANMRKSGLRAVNLREDDELISVQQTDGRSDLLIGTVNGMSIRFPEEEVRAVGRTAAGVRSITLRGDDKVVDMSVIDDSVRESGAQVLAVTENGYGKRTSIDAYRCQSRGGVGVRAMALSEKTGKLVNLMLIDEDMDLMVITDDGIIIRMPVDSISSQGRSTQGVRIMRVASDSRVMCVARSEREEEEIDETADETPETENEDGTVTDEEI